MRMDSLRAESGMGRRTRCAHRHSVHTLRVDVPVDDRSTRVVPFTVGVFDRQEGRNVKTTWGSTHDAAGVHGIMPVITGDTIRVVRDTRTVRGTTWARAFVDRVEGFDRWPQHVQAAVQAAEREALE